MAFADTLDTLSPAGSDAISLGDDAIRKLARALSERLISAFQDPDADPMLIKDGAIGADQLATALNLRSILRAQYAVTATVPANDAISAFVSIPGAVTGDHVTFQFQSPQDPLYPSGFVNAADQVTLFVHNLTSSPIDLADIVVDIAVVKTVFSA